MENTYLIAAVLGAVSYLMRITNAAQYRRVNLLTSLFIYLAGLCLMMRYFTDVQFTDTFVGLSAFVTGWHISSVINQISKNSNKRSI